MPAEEAMYRLSRRRLVVRSLVAAAVSATALVGCGDDTESGGTLAAADCLDKTTLSPVTAAEVAKADTSGVRLTLVTHDSFAVSDGLFDTFTKDTGITVEVLAAGDAGQVVSQAVLTKGKPVGDVLFGIDNTLLCRGLVNNVFTPYSSPALVDVPDELELDPSHRVSPVDVGDVCLNYSKAAFSGKTPPRSLDDLTTPALKDAFVTPNPETSSPGLAFLLATIAKYGDKGFEDYWKKLRANGLEVTSGWSEAYNDSFGGGKGKRSVVTSYATSPAADLMFADPPIAAPTIGVVDDSCFRQIEFAGILAGTKHPAAAAKLVDFLLSPTFQEDIPANMFVFPANAKAALPKEFTTTVRLVDAPLTLDPAEIEAKRDDWTERWTTAVLR
jgi:thiamine transport system substrate-binding protein